MAASSNKWEEFDTPVAPGFPGSSGGCHEFVPMIQMPVSDRAQDEYYKWCQRLLDIGLLDDLMRQEVENYVVSVDDLAQRIEKKQATRYPQERIASFLRKMRKIHEQYQPSSSTASQANPYAHFGFARRARQRRHG